LIIGSFNFLRMSSTAFSAQSLGQGSDDNAGEYLQQGIFLALGIGLVIVILRQPLSAWGLQLMQSQSTLSTQYTELRLLAAPASLVSFVMIGFAIGQQHSRIALYTVLASSLINIAGDIICIHYLDMNSQGAALASVLAEYAGCAIAVLLCLRSFPYLQQQCWRLHPQKLTQLWRVNRDLWLRSCCLLFVFTSFMAIANSFGSQTLAANAILMQLVLLQSYTLDGFANATEAMVGHSAGNKSNHSLIVNLKSSAYMSFACAVFMVVLLLALQPWIARSFSSTPTLIAEVNTLLPWVIALPLLSVWAYWLDGVAVGLTASRAMRDSILLASALVYLPICAFGVFYLDAGNAALWLAFFAFSAARSVFLFPMLYSKRFTSA
jgi:MATE family multidrug resistance protein